MKRTVLMPLLVTLLLTLSASAARAAPFTLTLIDLSPVGGGTITITDGGTGDINGLINQLTFLPKTVGHFTVATGSATTIVGGGPAPVEMVLPISFKVTSNSATGGSFEAILSVGDMTLPAGGAQARVLSNSTVISGVAATESVSFTSWVDQSNGAGETSAPVGAVQLLTSGNNLASYSAPFALAAQPFSLYSKLDFTFGGVGSMVASTDLQVINPIATPEPSTMLLFLSGAALIGLALFARRGSKKGSFQLFQEKGVVMKKTALLPLLVGLLMWFGAAPAQASPSFTLTLMDLTTPKTQVIVDNDSGDLASSDNDLIVAMGDIGMFNATINTGAVTFGGLFPVNMDLNSFLVTNLGTTGGAFRATLLRTDVDSSLLGSAAQADVIASYTVDLGSSATATFSSWISPTNSTTSGINVPTDGSLSAVIPLSGPKFSMYSQLDLVFTSGGGSSASGQSTLQVASPVATPEPGTMALFGSGLGMFGLVSLGRRRSKKDAV